MFELISITTLLISAVVSFIIGFMWYSPALFGNRWAQLANVKFDGNTPMFPCMIKAFGIALFQTLGMAWLFAAMNIVTFIAAAKLVAVITLVFVGAQMLNMYMWEKRSLELIAINLGHTFASLIAIATVLLYLA